MSSFKQRALTVVSQIPSGQVLTYQQVAAKAGRPAAYRAVGNILHQNHDPNIPCHRVIRTNGQIGGYNQGADKKLAILKEEGVRLRTTARQRTTKDY